MKEAMELTGIPMPKQPSPGTGYRGVYVELSRNARTGYARVSQTDWSDLGVLISALGYALGAIQAAPPRDDIGEQSRMKLICRVKELKTRLQGINEAGGIQ